MDNGISPRDPTLGRRTYCAKLLLLLLLSLAGSNTVLSFRREAASKDDERGGVMRVSGASRAAL